MIHKVLIGNNGKSNENNDKNYSFVFFIILRMTLICVSPVGIQYFFDLLSWPGVADSGVCTWPLLLL